MDLCLSAKVLIKKGQGYLEYPPALKSEPLKSHIQCESLYLPPNKDGGDEPYFIACSGSTYRSQDGTLKSNILGMFQNKKEANVVSFNHFAPITVPREKLEICIIDVHGKLQDLSCIGVFKIHGLINNKLLAL